MAETGSIPSIHTRDPTSSRPFFDRFIRDPTRTRPISSRSGVLHGAHYYCIYNNVILYTRRATVYSVAIRWRVVVRLTSGPGRGKPRDRVFGDTVFVRTKTKKKKRKKIKKQQRQRQRLRENRVRENAANNDGKRLGFTVNGVRADQTHNVPYTGTCRRYIQPSGCTIILRVPIISRAPKSSHR